MDTSELRDLKSDDRLKLKAVYNRYREEFIHFGRRYNLDHDALGDVYQEAFLAIRKQALRGRLDAVRSSMKTYLFGIGKFKIYDTLKAKKLEVLYEATDHIANEAYAAIQVHQEPELNAKQILLQKQLKKLGEKCREVLTLFYYRGLSIKEIADHAGYKNEGVVKAHKSRCLRTLREMMVN